MLTHLSECSSAELHQRAIVSVADYLHARQEHEITKAQIDNLRSPSARQAIEELEALKAKMTELKTLVKADEDMLRLDYPDLFTQLEDTKTVMADTLHEAGYALAELDIQDELPDKRNDVMLGHVQYQGKAVRLMVHQLRRGGFEFSSPAAFVNWLHAQKMQDMVTIEVKPKSDMSTEADFNGWAWVMARFAPPPGLALAPAIFAAAKGCELPFYIEDTEADPNPSMIELPDGVL